MTGIRRRICAPHRAARPLAASRTATAGLAVCAALAAGLAGATSPAGASLATTAAIAPTPPMGWNSWYRFGCGVSDGLIARTAATMATNGMRAAGYRYVGIDDCWMSHHRDARGRLVPDARRFPRGIAPLAARAHALGERLGIYLDTGSATCTGFPGSAGRERTDARTIAGWGVDELKLDFCRTRPAAAAPIYRRWAAALAATHRPILFDICEWGYQAPWLWAPGVGSTWRTAGDYFTYGAPRNYWASVLKVADLTAPLAAFSRPGAFNNPDALLVGTGYLSASEERAQMSLWSVLAAPLVAGGDLSHLSRQTLATLTNRSVIAVDQDRGGMQGTRIIDEPTRQVWLRRLAGGARILLFLNPTAHPGFQPFDVARIGLPRGRRYRLKDLWSGAAFSVPSSMRVWVGRHDVRIVRLGFAPPPPYSPPVSVTGPSADRRAVHR